MSQINFEKTIKSIGYFIDVSHYYFSKSVKLTIKDKYNETDYDFSEKINKTIQNIYSLLVFIDDSKQQDLQREIEELCEYVHKKQDISTIIFDNFSQDEIDEKMQSALKDDNKIDNMAQACDIDNFCGSSENSKSLNEIVNEKNGYNGDYAKSIMFLNLLIKYFSFLLLKFYKNETMEIKYEKNQNVCAENEKYQFISNIINYLCVEEIDIGDIQRNYLDYKIIKSDDELNVENLFNDSSASSFSESSDYEKKQGSSEENDLLDSKNENDTNQQLENLFQQKDDDVQDKSSFYLKKKQSEKSNIKYNISKIFKNKRHGQIKPSDLPSRKTNKMAKKIISSDNNFQILLKQHNDTVLVVQEENMVYKDNHGHTLLPEDFSAFTILQSSYNVDKSLRKTQRMLKQKFFELKLMSVLLNQNMVTESNVNQTYGIDDIDVLHFSDFPKSMFQEDSEYFLKIPILVSSGNMMDFEDFFKLEFFGRDYDGKSINRDFNSIAYIMRFICCLVHLKLGNLIITRTIKDKNSESISVHFDFYQLKSPIESFSLSMSIEHYQIFFNFLKRNELSEQNDDNEDGSFVYTMSPKQKEFIKKTIKDNNFDFPIFTYAEFKKVFQSSIYYDNENKQQDLFMQIPITSVDSGHTIDLVDFEDYIDSYETFEIETGDNDNDYNKENKIIYRIKDEYFLPDIQIQNLINRVYLKDVVCKCGNKEETCSKDGNYSLKNIYGKNGCFVEKNN